jgi:hypothetical protein
MMTAARVLLAIALAAVTSTVYAELIKIVIPAGRENVEGSEFIPGGPFPGRSQEIHFSTDFHALPPGGAWLVAINGRADRSLRSPVTVVEPQVKITVSTTQRQTPGAVFAENMGPDAVTVFDGRAVTIFPAFNPTPQPGVDPNTVPNPFTDIAYYETPFFYDPAQGNLLLDFISQGTQGSSFAWDAHPIGRVFGNGGPVNSPTANFFFSDGIVEQFVFSTVIPEPGSMALLGVGLCLAIAGGLRTWAAKRRLGPKQHNRA